MSMDPPQNFNPWQWHSVAWPHHAMRDGLALDGEPVVNTPEIGRGRSIFNGKELWMRRLVTHQTQRGCIVAAYCIRRENIEVGETGDFVFEGEGRDGETKTLRCGGLRLVSVTRISELDEIVLYVHHFVSVGMRD